MEKKLTFEESLQLELGFAEDNNAKLQEDLLDLQIKLNQKDIIISQYMLKDLERSNNMLKKEKETLVEKNRKAAENRKEFINSIKEEKDIKGGFGWNPDTLEIIEN